MRAHEYNDGTEATAGLGEALSSLRKWYTIHVRIEIYIVVVGCISFRREVSVNELHTHTHTYCIKQNLL